MMKPKIIGNKTMVLTIYCLILQGDNNKQYEQRFCFDSKWRHGQHHHAL